MRRETSTTEVSAVRVGSAGSEICESARKFASRVDNLARSLQNLHRGFRFPPSHQLRVSSSARQVSCAEKQGVFLVASRPPRLYLAGRQKLLNLLAQHVPRCTKGDGATSRVTIDPCGIRDAPMQHPLGARK